MASVYIIPEHRVDQGNRLIQAVQMPILMSNGQSFPQTHNISMQLPEIIAYTGYGEVLKYYGIKVQKAFDKREVEAKFRDPSVLTDLFEEHFRGRVVIWEVQGSWTIGFSRAEELNKYLDWRQARDADHHFNMVNQMTEQKYIDIATWMNENTSTAADAPGNLAYFGGNPPGLYTSVPTSVWIENPDTAFDFKMRFIGEAVA